MEHSLHCSASRAKRALPTRGARKSSQGSRTMQRVFHRTGCEEEEITPPCMKSRSFDSLSVAHILQAKLDPSAGQQGGSSLRPQASSFQTTPPTPDAHAASSPGSPTVDAAAALLRGVQSRAPSDDK